MILKNVSGQGVYLQAIDTTTTPYSPKTGDQANITGKYSLDGSGQSSFGTTNPTSVGNGLYYQPLAQGETNGNAFGYAWTSTTTGIVINPIVGLTDRSLSIIRTGTAQNGGGGTGIKLDSGASATNNLYNGQTVLITGGTGAGQARVILSYNGASKIATIDRAWITTPDNTSIFALLPTDSAALNANLQVTSSAPQVIIRSGTAQTGSTSTTIKLDSTASATNSIYVGDIVTLTGGTGLGQSRTILAYNGTTKVAIIDRAWVVTPDNTTTFNILASTAPSPFSDQGVAQAGSSSTITLQSTASSVNDIYNGSIVNILSGTDAGDTSEITAYNGSTKVATVSPNFSVAPDSTSSYIIIPALATIALITPPTSAQITTTILTDLVSSSDFLTSNSLGALLLSALTGNIPQTGDSYSIVNSGTFGNSILHTQLSTINTTVNTILGSPSDSSGVTTLLSRLTNTRATNLDFLTGDSYSIVNSGIFGNSVLQTQLNTLQITADTIITDLGSPSVSVSADIAAIKSDTGTILTDVNSGAGAIYTRIGAPIGASISADIAAVKSSVGTPAQAATALSNVQWTNTRAINLDFLTGDSYAIVNSGTFGNSILHTQLSTLQTTADTINVDLGTPVGASISADIAAVKSSVGTPAQAATALSNVQWTDVRAGLLDHLDANISTRSTYAGGAVASVTASVTVGTNNDKTGYVLGPTGLDSIPATGPTGRAATFREMVVQTWRRFFMHVVKDKNSSTIKTYADDATTVVTTQIYADDGTGNESFNIAN